MKYFGWVFLFFIVVYILPLNSRPLALPEYGFAEIAREMVVKGDYVTPQLRGTPQKQLPAPAYYPAAKSIQLFGKNGFAVRFPAALAAGLTALFIWILIKQMLRDEKLAALSSVIYLSFSVVYGSGTIASAASLTSMLTVGGCGCMFMALQEEKFNRRKMLHLILCGASIGLGFLTGGASALAIPFLAGTGYMIWDKKLRQLPLLWFFVLLTAALIVLPWGMAIERVLPGYWHDFVHTSWQSFLPTEQSSPWYWQLFFFVIGTFPASLLIPAAGVVGKEEWKGFLKQPLFRFAFCFMVLPLIFFSFNRTWDVNCVLPCLAPLALLTAAGIRVYFNSGGHHRSYNWMMTLWGAVLIIGGAGLIALRCVGVKELNMIPLSQLFYPVVGGTLIFAGIVMVYSVTGNWRGRLYLFFFGIGLVMLFLPWFFCGSSWMPGKALQEINERFCKWPKKRTFTVSAATDALANAAAWEMGNPNIKVSSYGNAEPGILITPCVSGENYEFSQDGTGVIAVSAKTVSPEAQLLKDLTR